MHCLTFSQLPPTSRFSSMNHVVKSVDENVHTLLPYCSQCWSNFTQEFCVSWNFIMWHFYFNFHQDIT